MYFVFGVCCFFLKVHSLFCSFMLSIIHSVHAFWGRIPLLNHHFGVTSAEVAIICHIHFMSSQNMLHVNILCFNSQHVVIHRKHNKS